MKNINIVFDGSGMSNRDVAIVVLEMEGLQVSGTAKRDPRDEPNEDIGQRLAMARAFQALGYRLERQARGLIKHADEVALVKSVRRHDRQVLSAKEYDEKYGPPRPAKWRAKSDA